MLQAKLAVFEIGLPVARTHLWPALSICQIHSGTNDTWLSIGISDAFRLGLRLGCAIQPYSKVLSRTSLCAGESYAVCQTGLLTLVPPGSSSRMAYAYKKIGNLDYVDIYDAAPPALPAMERNPARQPRLPAGLLYCLAHARRGAYYEFRG